MTDNASGRQQSGLRCRQVVPSSCAQTGSFTSLNSVRLNFFITERLKYKSKEVKMFFVETDHVFILVKISWYEAAVTDLSSFSPEVPSEMTE